MAKESLRQGWDGAWTNIAREDKIRQGLWGDYSRVSASLTLPDLSSFPIATPIPYSFHVTTETKMLDRSDRPQDKHAKPLFPAPPTHSANLKQTLSRRTEIRVRKRTENVRETFDLQGIRHKADTWNARGVEAVVDEPEWIPKDDKGRGFWRRTVHFSSTLALPFAPTFKTEILDWAYSLHFVVPFPGIGNDLKLQLPIHLGPGSACPPPPIGAPGSSSLTYADVLPAGPPPMVDLPPAYWSGDAHDWDEDEKS
ncbi:hypothetical protein C8R46DRAFT_379429 [Mycena filopes]|nr:hypothetical protein C8R46DRAFT_379429 [Mycena filopes]